MVHDSRFFKKGDQNLLIDLIMTLVALERSHNESLTKSIRGKKNVKLAVESFLSGNRGKNGKPLRIPSYYLPFWIKVVDKELFIDEPIADLVREMVKRLTRGDSINSVYDFLKQHPHPKGKQWVMDTVIKLHRNHALYGHCVMSVNGTDTELNGYLEPIISRKQFLELQESRSRVNVQSKREDGQVSVLSGFGASYCRCGCPLTTTIQKTRTRIQCSSVFSSTYKGKCDNPVRTEEGYILDFLNKNLIALVFTDELTPNDNKLEIQELQKQLNHEQKLHDKFYAQYSSTGDDFLLDLIRDKRSRIDNLRDNISSLSIPNDLDQVMALKYIPSDRVELRDIYRRIIKSLKLYRVSRGKTLVQVYTHSNYNVSALFVMGKIKEFGYLTGSMEQDAELVDDTKFNHWISKNKVSLKFPKA